MYEELSLCTFMTITSLEIVLRDNLLYWCFLTKIVHWVGLVGDPNWTLNYKGFNRVELYKGRSKKELC